MTPLFCMILGWLARSCFAGDELADAVARTNTTWEKLVAITEQQDVFALLASNQSPEDCKTAKYLVLKGGGAGLGWEFHYNMAGLYFGQQHNRTVIFETEVNPANKWR
jgi:hypothetical protein